MATQGAHTEAPGGKKAFPPFQKETFASQLVWLAIFFIALYVLMSRLALPRVGGIIAARADKISGDIAQAQRLKGETDAAIAAYEKVLAEARSNAQAIAGTTRDKLTAEADARRKVLEDQLQRKLEEADKTIAQTKTAAMTNVRGIAVTTAAAIVERLVGSTPDDKAIADAVDAALKG